jgi:hypothetical protein
VIPTTRTVAAVVGIATAWLLPLATHVVGVDWLLPPVLVTALMAVQRGSARLLDRFVLAVAELTGATCVAGLALSFWPWGLHPVPVFGVALTALVAIALATGRWFPRRRRATSDARGRLVLAGTAGVTAIALVPLAGRDIGGRVGLLAAGEDFARHFVLYDAIGHLGGYAFVQLDRASGYAPDGAGVGVLTYPQGAHLLYALLANFRYSGSLWFTGTGGRPAGDAVTAMDWLIWCQLATFAFLALAVLWAVRRVAGPGCDVWALLVVLVPVAAYLVFGDPVSVLFRGYPNELLALALAAVLTAIVARPLHSLGEQVVTVSVLVVGISFTYYLYLPFAALAALVWAANRWRALLRRPVLVVLAVLLAPLALVTPLANPQANNGDLLVTKGTAIPVDRPLAVLLVVVAFAGLLLRDGWRSPARRRTTLVLGLALATVVVLGVYQYATVGYTVYYFTKAVHLLIVVALVATGALVRLVPRQPRRVLSPALAASLVIGAGIAALGGPNHTRPRNYGLRVLMFAENGSQQGGDDAVLIARRYPDPADPVTVDLMHSPYANFFGTLFASALRRDYRHGEIWYGLLNPSGGPKTEDDFERLVAASPKPVRILVAGVNVEVAEKLAAKYPGRVLIERVES